MLPYSQSTEYSTAAAGLTAILNHRNKEFKASSENELAAWRASVNLPTRSSSIFGLAAFAKQHGAQPQVIVENLEYDYPDYRFDRYKKSDIELAQKMHELHIARAKELGVSITEKEILFSDLQQLVFDGYVLLIRLNEGVLRGVGSTSKYLVVYGFENNQFLVLDPMQEKPLLKVAPELLQESFDTLATKKKRVHRMMVF